jgi:hypothetical protein
MANKSSEHGGFICEGTISHGTLRTQDLLRAFANEYERILPFNGRDLASEARQNADILDMPNQDTPRNNEIAHDVLNDLFDALDTVAHREGMYFGAHEGDGSDFGFWMLETESEE